MMGRTVKRFLADQRGLETVEYAIMITLIVTASLTALGGLLTAISGEFARVAGTVNTP